MGHTLRMEEESLSKNEGKMRRKVKVESERAVEEEHCSYLSTWLWMKQDKLKTHHRPASLTHTSEHSEVLWVCVMRKILSMYRDRDIHHKEIHCVHRSIHMYLEGIQHPATELC